ncbi:hypothetical protein GDO86_005004 [Hymenochirus boettgeri]|uniref:Uncharacterized protein n=1 Tax=Hymenochirus boettgeri TaxID=247094 RepID=A0A8T2J027_9PIPI|nr:hypothetical protein GDO86_005004 [Hymenochirus boettgeri]
MLGKAILLPKNKFPFILNKCTYRLPIKTYSNSLYCTITHSTLGVIYRKWFPNLGFSKILNILCVQCTAPPSKICTRKVLMNE